MSTEVGARIILLDPPLWYSTRNWNRSGVRVHLHHILTTSAHMHATSAQLPFFSFEIRDPLHGSAPPILFRALHGKPHHNDRTMEGR